MDRMMIMAVSRGIEPRLGYLSWEIDIFLRLAPCLAGFDPLAHYRNPIRANADFLEISGPKCVGGSFRFNGSGHGWGGKPGDRTPAGFGIRRRLSPSRSERI